ncbi:MAG: phosphatidylglycerophosphatase A [bacterium]
MTASGKPESFYDRLILFFARGFGSGCLPLAPGSWGSAVGVAIFVLLYFLAGKFIVVFHLLVFVVIVVSFPICGFALKFYSRSDPSEIVYDEIAGQFLALLPVYWFAGTQWFCGGLLGGFILFRLFDISKLFPVNYFERLPGGWGVVADDLAAGVYAAIFLTLLAAVTSFVLV